MSHIAPEIRSNQSLENRELLIRIARLELIAATLPLIEAESASKTRLGDLLNAEIGVWPAPLNDESSLRWTVEKLRAHPEHAGYYVWYIVLTEQEKRKLVGLAAFKGPPDDYGTIEAGYSVIEEFQKQGIGTQATRALVQWAFGHPAVKLITAETFPNLRASIRVMERCGMTFLGEGSESGTIRYGITRERFEKLLLEERR